MQTPFNFARTADSAASPHSSRAPVHSLRLFNRLPMDLDLRDEVALESLLATADALVGRTQTIEELDSIETLLAHVPDEWPLAARVAVKLARSKALIAQRVEPLHLSVVLPVYLEHQRMLRPHEHELGEGFLDRKLRQLDWLLGQSSNKNFDLLIVDDGCPEDSGARAEQVLRERHPDAPARVVYLEEAIASRVPVVSSMNTTSESRKGGSIQYGLWEATRQARRGHIVLYTDADLSTHLGQAGLLIDALDRPGIRMAAGSRRRKGSVVVKADGRSSRGRLFIYLWKKLLPELAYLHDTQCGFKAMPARVARSLTDAPRERGFAFDLEMLLRVELMWPRSIAAVPIAWIDSEAASTTDELSPYLNMLRSTVGLSRHYLGKRRGPDSFAMAIEALDESAWRRAIEIYGPLLEDCDPALDRDATILSAAGLRAALA